MKTTNMIYLMSVLIIAGIAISAVSAEMYELDYTSSDINSEMPNLVVAVLKYEPYPVSAGEWFDVWIKIQNNGETDATNVIFELKPEYPFYANDSLVKNYGTILGTINAYKSGMSDDANEVIMKYRVKTADNAPEGDSDMKLGISCFGSICSETILSLPITIGKTKTDFDVVMQDSSASDISFTIANIGRNDATAVTVSILPQAGLGMTGTQSSIIGNLDTGDFTTISFEIAPGNLKTLAVQIAYTDTAGVRNTIEKNVTISSANSAFNDTMNFGQMRTARPAIPFYVYIAIGLIIGFLLGLLAPFVLSKLRKKRV